MEEMIRLIVMQEDRTEEVPIYLSILIAYLELENWQDAKKILRLLNTMDMLSNEQRAYTYLFHLWQLRDKTGIHSLITHLENS